ncbi:MAG: WG repeat-containing protein [Treponema sp.]|nr:WG repeat-containing protein [Treponema sp.]
MKKIMILFIYLQLSFLYSMDLYRIKNDGKYGFIDDKKNIVIEMQYDYAENFWNGYSIVRIEKNNQTLYSVINENNKTVAEELKDCSCLSRVSDTVFFNSFEGFFYDLSKKKIIELDKTANPFFYNNRQKYYYPRTNYDSDKIEYVDKDSKIVFTFDNAIKAFAMTDDMAFVIKKDWTQIIINKKGEVILSDIYDCGMNSSEGLLAVETKDNSGYINNKGKFLINCSFEPNNHNFLPPGINYPFSEGIAVVQVKRGIFKIFDSNGNVLMNEMSALDMKPSSNGFILYQSTDKKYGFLKKNGTQAFKTEFDYAEPFFNGMALVVFKGKDAVLDSSGNLYLAKDLASGNKKQISIH